MSPTRSITRRTENWFSKNLDSGFGIFFANHVIGGYQFLLRYYCPGDKIYMFGFSRGAYTARLPASMVDNIGLLSQGNEEMISFAWETFSNHQRHRSVESEGYYTQFMEAFRCNFCRPLFAGDEVKLVHFLGLFDCVNSVLAFSESVPRPDQADLEYVPATYVRHAVAIHEHRAMFQPVLFAPAKSQTQTSGEAQVVELWFAGNHGDVGGGWKMEKGETYLLSDIPLMWMIQQVQAIDLDSKVC
jgi:uncharacterized protein (DUF2235 family)